MKRKNVFEDSIRSTCNVKSILGCVSWGKFQSRSLNKTQVFVYLTVVVVVVVVFFSLWSKNGLLNLENPQSYVLFNWK